MITALANNTTTVERFIDEANRIAIHTANQRAALQGSLQRLPTFLEQLRPSLRQLGATTDANLPVLANLDSAAGELNRLLTDLPGFSRSARPALRTLGQASVTGKVAVQAAQPTITHLNQFAKPTPELAQNLAIVGHDLDDRSRAVEKDPRSPHGQGYTGLEAVLQYAFNQTLAINTFGPFGHQLAVDGFVSAMCTPYATPGTIAMNLKTFGPRYRSCYSWLGPSQPGVNEPDPSNPSACVPDPGGAPPGDAGPSTSSCRLNAADTARGRTAADTRSGTTTQAAERDDTAGERIDRSGRQLGGGRGLEPPRQRRQHRRPERRRDHAGPVSAGAGLQQTIGQILGALGGGGSGARGASSASGPSGDRERPAARRPGQAGRQPGPATPQLPARAMRRSQASAFANPVLVGAVTVLIIMVAVFLAYNANQGLPFVPTRELKVDVADASNLVIGNDVREGGFRIGLVSDMKPTELPNGQVGAVLTLRLDKANGTVPVDSKASVVPRSLLGLKYVDIEKGTSNKIISDGGTLPLSHTSIPVQLDDVFNTFDAKTRQGIESGPARVREHVDRSGARSQRHDREPAGAARASAAGDRVSGGSQHGADAVHRHAQQPHGRDRAGRADERSAARRFGDDVRARSRGIRTHTSRRSPARRRP